MISTYQNNFIKQIEKIYEGKSCVINVEWPEQAPKKVRANKPQNYNHCKRKQNEYVD